MRQAPASFDDHFSQPRLFWLSMNPAEREHIVAALHLRARQVVQGLGLPAPEPSEPLADVQLSPTLSQVGHIDGQRIRLCRGSCDVAGLSWAVSGCAVQGCWGGCCRICPVLSSSRSSGRPGSSRFARGVSRRR
ncbi:catalase-related domain-containing protein [Streptomyces sp. NPDC088354]|uniref:catalase-related domain-containing protein n=1 Tax=Streptomyces sp. NPDC088354 TaxID=3365856 RepID=UPI0038070540